ncbi:NAD(P)-binding protein [Bacteroides fragilis]|nr:NAD(P)-binding protein [Bacteroides fragilis]
MSRIAVIGAGISGLSIAQLLREDNEVQVYEAESRPGGLVKCERVNGHLYHLVGGHVFNAKRKDVFDFFWSFFRESDFKKTDRNSVILMKDEFLIPYPIEDHLYYFEEQLVNQIIKELLEIHGSGDQEFTNFDEFLRGRFGNTLYDIYFQPYNEKIWRKKLTNVPLAWLEGKLPMPTVREIILNNIKHIEEKKFIHSSFYYPLYNGSQFLVDNLSLGLDIKYNVFVETIEKTQIGWKVNGVEYDKVIFCGNVKDLVNIIGGEIDALSNYKDSINEFESHGTTSVLCEIEDNPYSWIYMPNRAYLAHRIICTGNFAESNKGNGTMSATIEFTDYMAKEDILENLKRISFAPKYLAHKYTEYTYPIQNIQSRTTIVNLKKILEPMGLFLLGRFAEWEYYNMDAAMGAAIDLKKNLTDNA